MTAAAVLLIIGCGDLAIDARYLYQKSETASRRSWGDWVLAALAWLIAAGLLYWGAGAPWSAVAIGLVVAVVASLLLKSPNPAVALFGCFLLLGAIAVAFIFDGSRVSERSPLASLAAGAPQAIGLMPTSIVLGISAIVFLTATSNALVRAVLDVAGSNNPTPATPVGADEAWRVQRRGRDIAVVIRAEPRGTPNTFLGGRIVGPLERVIVFASLLTGLPVVIAGLIAAKGVVRFPEISADRDGGTKAEAFLVGTLCSLLLAGLAVLALTTRLA